MAAPPAIVIAAAGRIGMSGRTSDMKMPPEAPMTDGKARSISPETITKTSAVVMMIVAGRLNRNAL